MTVGHRENIKLAPTADSFDSEQREVRVKVEGAVTMAPFAFIAYICFTR